MKNFGKLLTLAIFSTISIITLVTAAGAQDDNRWGYGPVVVYSERDGGGTVNSFNVGTYRNDRGDFGGMPNDSIVSVSIPAGYRVRFCEDEGRTGQGSGRCEEFGEGNHNLRYPNRASYMRITGPAGSLGWRGGWIGGGQTGVTVYEDRDGRGRSQSFGVGRFLNMGRQLGNLRNDRASSVVVERGFRVRLCEDEGTLGVGAGSCEEYAEGTHNLRYDNSASYVEVMRGRGWGWGNNSGWGNNDPTPIDDGAWVGRTGAILFADRDQRGTRQRFDIGTFRSDRGDFNTIGNDQASSIRVRRGYRARVCQSEGRGGNGAGRCEEFGPGDFNLRYNDAASYISVWRN